MCKYKLNTNKKKLLAELGNAYSVKQIDRVECIYRDFGGYDMEICGGSYHDDFAVYIWSKHPQVIVQRHMFPSDDCKKAKALVELIASWYIPHEAQEGENE